MQVDLLIDRKDNAINFCEIIHYEAGFGFDKKTYTETRSKLQLFKEKYGTKKQLFYTLISNQPATDNE